MRRTSTDAVSDRKLILDVFDDLAIDEFKPLNADKKATELKRKIIEHWILLRQQKCLAKKTNGHSWISHYYIDELKVWVWNCGECGCINVRTTMGDLMWIDPSTGEVKALNLTGAFKDPLDTARKVLEVPRR